jgi:hypothetical protein
VATKTVSLKSNPQDGSFSFTVEAGPYTIAYTIPGFGVIQFSILVPSSGTFTIDQVVSTSPQGVAYALSGSGNPNGVVQGSPGYTYFDIAGGCYYVKASGTGNLGWQALVQL